MKRKITLTTKVPGSFDREVTYNDAQIFINEDTQGILIIGQVETYSKTGRKTLYMKKSNYVPFVLIKQVEIMDPDGGLMVCKDARLLSVALDVRETMDQLRESA